MASIGAREDEFGLQIAPMLDILFVLLLFFMVAAGVQKHEAQISTTLPGTIVHPSGLVPVLITIDANGQVSINDAASDTPDNHALPQTVTRLKAMIANSPEQPVFLTPAPSTRQQRVIDVLNACTAAGVKNLSFGSSGG
jgi:biopolymer transport protein ExbD